MQNARCSSIQQRALLRRRIAGPSATSPWKTSKRQFNERCVPAARRRSRCRCSSSRRRGPFTGAGRRAPTAGTRSRAHSTTLACNTTQPRPGAAHMGAHTQRARTRGRSPMGAPTVNHISPTTMPMAPKVGRPHGSKQAPGLQSCFCVGHSRHVERVPEKQRKTPRYVQVQYRHLHTSTLGLCCLMLPRARSMQSWPIKCVLGRQASLSRACPWVGSRAPPAGTPTRRPAHTPPAPTRPQMGRAGRLRYDPTV